MESAVVAASLMGKGRPPGTWVGVDGDLRGGAQISSGVRPAVLRQGEDDWLNHRLSCLPSPTGALVYREL
jgi:hypothetical protein